MSEDADESGRLQLDDVLQRLGGLGRHQATTLGLLALVYATNSMYNVNYVFAVEDVGYRCTIPACESTPANFSAPWLQQSGYQGDLDSIRQCQHFPTLKGGCHFDNTTMVQCQEWVYEKSNSFVAEFDLACEEWKQALVGTAHCFGNMLGLLVQGQISDRFGRKTAAVFAGTMGAVLGITKSFSTSFWLYVVLEALEAAIGDALSPMFMLSVEIVEKKKAVLFQMILLNFYTCGLIVMPFIAWSVPYWRHFLRVIYTPTLLILTYTLYLDESIRWLFSKGKKERGIKLIEKVARRNKIEIDKATLYQLEYKEEVQEEFNDKELLKKTFKSRVMLRRFAVCLVWWFTIQLINYGMMISSVFFDGNKYINFALLMMMDIPSNIFYWVALSKYKRKVPLVASFLIGGIFCITQPFVPKGYAWLGLTLLMSFETLATFSYNIVYMYTSELFPTYTRNSVHALCGAMGRLGSLIAPQAPVLISYWSGLPAFLFGLTSLISGFLALFMPETAQCELPDSVEEAEMIGHKRRRKKDSLLEGAEMIGQKSKREEDSEPEQTEKKNQKANHINENLTEKEATVMDAFDQSSKNYSATQEVETIAQKSKNEEDSDTESKQERSSLQDDEKNFISKVDNNEVGEKETTGDDETEKTHLLKENDYCAQIVQRNSKNLNN